MPQEEEARDAPLARKLLPDGREVRLVRMIFTTRLTICDEPNAGYYDDGWCYESPAAALLAFNNWNGEGEPPNWTRHPKSGRRRPGGDPTKEYVIL